MSDSNDISKLIRSHQIDTIINQLIAEIKEIYLKKDDGYTATLINESRVKDFESHIKQAGKRLKEKI